jgi:hypothetical protein
MSPFLPKSSSTISKRNCIRIADSSHFKETGKEANSEVRETFMGAVFGDLEEDKLITRQDHRYYPFPLPKSAACRNF